ncbi:MAG TPA: lysylphosphatidylglycerol synthase transmembrane domain-containing protein [Gemmatimonadaceae bacterium]|nr:lysylphosphatidylglycerol synthase transmembrane domain-containing protein [Gemmatimonadaceae bacterium]
MNAAWLRVAARVVAVMLVLFAVALFATRVEWTETWRAMRGASPAIFAAAALINLASLALKGVRWWIFLRPVGGTSLALTLRGTFAGAALNNLLLANVGEPARVMLVARASRVPSERVLATLALERLFEFTGYVMLLAVAVSVLTLPPDLHRARPVAFGALVAVALLLIYLVRHPASATASPAARLTMLQRAAAYGQGFISALASSRRRFIAALALSVVVWSLQVATYQLTARAAHFDIPVSGTIAAILSVNIGFAIRATPGNVGVFQAVYALAATAFGMDRDAAVGVGILIQAQQILPVTLIGVLAAPSLVLRPRHLAEPPVPPARA